jgi:hypothetical protein
MSWLCGFIVFVVVLAAVESAADTSRRNKARRDHISSIGKK